MVRSWDSHLRLMWKVVWMRLKSLTMKQQQQLTKNFKRNKRILIWNSLKDTVIPRQMRRKVFISAWGGQTLTKITEHLPPPTRGMKRTSSSKSRNEIYTNFGPRTWKCHQILILTTFCNQKIHFVIFQLFRIKC